MKPQTKRRWSELRRVKRDLECYKVAKRNTDRFFETYPDIGELFQAWMLMQIIDPPPTGGRRIRKAA